MQTRLQIAEKAFHDWKNTPITTRVDLLNQLQNNLVDHKVAYATLISREMGKPITQAIAEIEKCAWLCRYYAETVPLFLQPNVVAIEGTQSYTIHEPLGVILGVMPWNFPFWQVFRFAIPAIMIGNTVVVKHASLVPETAQLLEAVFEKSGFPEGVYQNIFISSNQVANLIAHPIVKAVSLTGSELAGRAVAAQAGQHLKKCVLELGGNNAFIVCEDANLDHAVTTAVMARMQNNGQSCIAAKRFLIHENIHDAFVVKFIHAIKQLKKGNPLEFTTQISALARLDLAIDLEEQLAQSITLGATIVEGGNRDEAFFEPTIVTNIVPGMPLFDEETFGPVAAITTFKTLDEAIALSNQSSFGLGVSIFTQNVKKIKPHFNAFNEGAVFVNEMVKSDPRLPFGGIKNSGYGRELALEGLKEFANLKTVVVYS